MCCEATKSELTTKNFGFGNVWAKDFQRAKINICQAGVYAAWKLIGFLIMFSYIVYKNVVEIPVYGARIYVYSSCWALIMAMLYFGLSFLALISDRGDEDKPQRDLKWIHKAIWVLHSMTFSWSIVATTVYWIFRFDEGQVEFERELASHGMGLTLMTVDLLLISFPVRVLHFIYAFSVCAFYIVLTVFYWLSGGAPIYFMLDWDHGLKAFLCGLGVLSSIVTSHICVYFVWKLVTCCYNGPCKSLTIHSTHSEKDYKPATSV